MFAGAPMAQKLFCDIGNIVGVCVQDVNGSFLLPRCELTQLSVQFVIKTEDIKVEESEESKAETKESLSFWQKFLKLFGIE